MALTSSVYGDEFEYERLRAELAQEKQMKEMLEQSMGELQLTIDELEKRIDSVDNESNEWKTRFETQTEMNQQLEKQKYLLQDRVEEAKQLLKESTGRAPKALNGIDAHEITPHYVKQLEREKNSIEKQMRDLEWRLDQESKAYHKANEERKVHVMEINAAKGAIDQMKTQQARNADLQKSINMNIPQDQRILDLKRGPIRKTAAIKNLPKLD